MTLAQLQADIHAWQLATFGPDGPESSRPRLKKLEGEVRELMLAIYSGHFKPTPAVADEIADVAIVLMGLASSFGYDLEDLIATKMVVNRLRTWRVDEHGVYRHE